jgi:signal transduction histidine kinase
MAAIERPTAAQAEKIHKFAHDLKNRLSAMHEVLRQVADASGAEKQEFLGFGEQQFFKALRHVEELMDDLQIDRTVKEFTITSVPLAELVKNQAELLKHRFEKKQQHLHLDLDGSVSVKADPHYLQESIGALLSNASKFSPRDTDVQVVLKKKDDAAELCVIDKGVGLTEDDLQKIFTRYAWLSSRSTAGEAQGRGSLARAHQWLQGMGGELKANSDGPGEGCSFSLRLPVA